MALRVGAIYAIVRDNHRFLSIVENGKLKGGKEGKCLMAFTQTL